jgi:predicted acylesterase/phospholipase RssA
MNSIGVQPADVVIEPDVTQFGMTHFSRADELAARGEAATLQAIPSIKNLLQKVDRQLFQ